MKPRRRRTALGLRLRLLISYLVLLMVALGVIASALFVLLGNRPAPAAPTYERLAALTQGLNLLNTIADLPRDADLAFIQEQIPELLDAFAQSRNVRTLQIRLTSEGPLVLYDSADRFEVGQTIRLLVDAYKSEPLGRVLPRGSEQFFGGFSDPGGSEWLFGGLRFRQARPFVDLLVDDNLWILAEPRPTVSLQETLADFGSALAPPLVQAAIAGIVFAVILAALISRMIAKPVQRVALAATDVARGDYDVQVPASGPPELRSLAESFNSMTAEVLASNNAQRDFLSNVSHDLRTPLTSIQGYAQALIDGAADDPKAAAEIIYEEAGRLNRMVIELTDLQQLQAGRLSMSRESIDMSRLVNDVVQSLQVVADKQNIQLVSSSSPTPRIIADGDRLAQVLMNLIGNAVKFTPAGGQVRVRTETRDSGVAVDIQDTGIGIPPHELRRVFERFYQVDKARGPQRGTGLGLAIAKEIVDAHGGAISAHSGGRDQGAAFRVWLPSASQFRQRIVAIDDD